MTRASYLMESNGVVEIEITLNVLEVLIFLYFRQQSTLNLLADDHIVLTKLIYSLGIMVYAAVNAPVRFHYYTNFIRYSGLCHYNKLSIDTLFH